MEVRVEWRIFNTCSTFKVTVRKLFNCTIRILIWYRYENENSAMIWIWNDALSLSSRRLRVTKVLSLFLRPVCGTNTWCSLSVILFMLIREFEYLKVNRLIWLIIVSLVTLWRILFSFMIRFRAIFFCYPVYNYAPLVLSSPSSLASAVIVSTMARRFRCRQRATFWWTPLKTN